MGLLPVLGRRSCNPLQVVRTLTDPSGRWRASALNDSKGMSVSCHDSSAAIKRRQTAASQTRMRAHTAAKPDSLRRAAGEQVQSSFGWENAIGFKEFQ